MIPKEKKPTPLLDLCEEGKRKARLLSIIKSPIFRDLEPPVIVISEQLRDAVRELFREERK